MRTIFFLSDFGRRDAYVGIVEAVIAGLAPDARVVHLTHDVPPQDLRHGAHQLWAAAPFLPDRSVVLAVVDPGVGTSRRAVVIEGERLTWVAPDNGLCGAALDHDRPTSAYAIDTDGSPFGAGSATFHGRDLFGPAAAQLAQGAAASEFGAPLDPSGLTPSEVRPRDGLVGEIWTYDHFGNAITNLRAPSAPPSVVTVAGHTIPWARTYADVAPGEPLALAGSTGLVEISVRGGSAERRLGLRADASLPVSLELA